MTEIFKKLSLNWEKHVKSLCVTSIHIA